LLFFLFLFYETLKALIFCEIAFLMSLHVLHQDNFISLKKLKGLKIAFLPRLSVLHAITPCTKKYI